MYDFSILNKLLFSMKKTALFFFLLVCVYSSLPYFQAHAEIYKWVDEKGVTQYGERPPVESKAQKINIPASNKPVTPSAKPLKDSGTSIQDQETEFRKRQIAREESEAKEVERKAELKEACIQAKDDLLSAINAGQIYVLNDKGERVFRSDAQRIAYIAKLQATYDNNCKGVLK